jgi:AcrR family transcriptional regulator
MPSSLAPGALTADRILAAAEDVVRRHGPDKATVVDVAQALGVSHGSIYRFFPTKVALREAVVAVWLGRIETALEAESPGTEGRPALDRIEAWLRCLWELKRAQKAQDPELFEAFRQLSDANPEPVRAYKVRIEAQLAALVAQGTADLDLVPGSPETTARALLTATTRFSHPAFASYWDTPQSDADFDQLWAVLARGIQHPRKFL